MRGLVFGCLRKVSLVMVLVPAHIELLYRHSSIVLKAPVSQTESYCQSDTGDCVKNIKSLMTVPHVGIAFSQI